MRTAQESGRLARPIPVSTFPYVTTIEVEDASARPDSWVVLTSLPPASLTEASGRALTTR